jgi:hypothetical protein
MKCAAATNRTCELSPRVPPLMGVRDKLAEALRKRTMNYSQPQVFDATAVMEKYRGLTRRCMRARTQSCSNRPPTSLTWLGSLVLSPERSVPWWTLQALIETRSPRDGDT